MIQKHSGGKKLRDVWRHLILHPRISSRLHQTRKADLRIEQIWRWTKEGERRLFELRKYNQQTEFAADPRISTVNSDSWNLMDLISNETTFWNSILLQKYGKKQKLWSESHQVVKFFVVVWYFRDLGSQTVWRTTRRNSWLSPTWLCNHEICVNSVRPMANSTISVGKGQRWVAKSWMLSIENDQMTTQKRCLKTYTTLTPGLLHNGINRVHPCLEGPYKDAIDFQKPPSEAWTLQCFAEMTSDKWWISTSLDALRKWIFKVSPLFLQFVKEFLWKAEASGL